MFFLRQTKTAGIPQKIKVEVLGCVYGNQINIAINI